MRSLLLDLALKMLVHGPRAAPATAAQAGLGISGHSRAAVATDRSAVITLMTAFKPISGDPERQHAHDMGQAARHDEADEQQEDPPEFQVLALVHEPDQREWNGEIGEWQ